jgi:peptidoglycan-associated lipoprotein
MFANVVKIVLLTAVVGLLFSACTKKPKIDLSGLRESPAGTSALPSAALASGPDFSGGEFSVAGVGSEPLFAETGAFDSGSSGGAWSEIGKPVGALGGENFLADSQVWNEVVYFAYDRAEVSPSERYKLDALAKTLLAAPGQGVIIEGHCDDRGSDEYNRALSERRALSVREYLTTLGVADNRMLTISYGEDKPVIPNARTEAEHQQNRRAQFLLGNLR